ncbi:tautomerase family protein [Terrarubrum flagellatum]|uniref:tautomerase family protein n=1 Tax=Terrirubrum flagellatum TaxID=2895980 RepID=UPI0031454928
MPILTARYTNPKGEPDARFKIVAALAEFTQSILRKRPEVTSILVEEASGDHWLIGRKPLSSHGLATFFLDIKVTAGTNTKEEIAAYIDAVHARVGATVGPLHEASYIVVDEVPAANWGFGGRTQEERFIAGRSRPAMAA